MRKFLISGLIFLCFSSVIYVLLIVLTGIFFEGKFRMNLPYSRKVSSGFSFSRLNEAEKVRDIDILVLGSSHAYRGYDPRIFKKEGFSLFNLGSSAQTPIQTDYLVNKYLNKMNPKFVIVDVYPKVFDSDGVESTVDLLSNMKIEKDFTRLALKQSDIKVINTMIYALIRQVFNFDIHYVEKKIKGNNEYVPGGYVQSFTEYKPKSSYEKETYNLSRKQLSFFDRVINVLKRKNIPYIILQSPIPQSKYKNVMNGPKIDSAFSKYGFYRNGNTLLNLPDSCFFDDSHLNQYGVNQYNSFVIKLIKENAAFKK